MIIIGRFNGDKDPVENLNLDRFINEGRDCYLFMGNAYNDVFNPIYLDKERVFLSLEEPNFCTDADTAHAKLITGYGSTTVGGYKSQDTPPDKVLTLCPFMSKLFDNRTLIFFPFNEDFIPESFDKKYDVIYTGGHPNNTNWGDVIKTISKYNYRYVYHNHSDFVTDTNISYREKIKLYSESKITVTHNLATAWPQFINRYREFPRSNENEAFKNLESTRLPQFKSRVMEAAFTKSLIVNYYDEWNVIENWFEPNKDFIYFKDSDDLDLIIKDVLNNPEKYELIIESAFNKAINNYTTKHFVNKYLI